MQEAALSPYRLQLACETESFRTSPQSFSDTELVHLKSRSMRDAHALGIFARAFKRSWPLEYPMPEYHSNRTERRKATPWASSRSLVFVLWNSSDSSTLHWTLARLASAGPSQCHSRMATNARSQQWGERRRGRPKITTDWNPYGRYVLRNMLIEGLPTAKVHRGRNLCTARILEDGRVEVEL